MANLSKIKRDQLLNEIKTIENKYSSDTDTLNTLNKLKQEITNKKYGLVWEEHSEKVDEMLVDNIPVFTEDKSREIVSDKSLPYNFLIEGDNLHALKVLEKTHKGKIDVIYIDPPYNTGKKDDFKYDDKIVDVNDTFKHSKWLSFMSERLNIAKELLSDNGIIFISIDDHEEEKLKLLCNQIFGENNFVQNYIWESNYKPDNSSPLIRPNAENVLCYLKHRTKYSSFNKYNSQTSGLASLTKSKESKKTITFPSNTVKTTLRDGKYEKGKYDKKGWELENDIEVQNGIIISEVKLTGNSYWATPDKISKEINNGTEIWIKSTNFIPYYKKVDSGKVVSPTILPRNMLDDYQSSKEKLEEIFNKSSIFNNPKPVSLIKFLISYNQNKNSTILDFFAGSGTTGHAILELNMEDSGDRKFILCTNNENNICEDITYPRIKTVITGKRIDGTQYSNGIPANLKYYKTDFIPKNKYQKQIQTNQSMNPTSGINEVTLCDKLQDHIRELVQLETHHNIDDDFYKMVLNDVDLNNLITNINTYKNLKEIYISSTILLDSNQKQILQSKNIKISEIPDYYFSNELKENGELW